MELPCIKLNNLFKYFINYYILLSFRALHASGVPKIVCALDVHHDQCYAEYTDSDRSCL